MLAVLTVIAVVAGSVLAYVNSVTAPQIEKIKADNLAAGIKAVMGSDQIQVAEPQEVDGFKAYAITDASAQSLGTAIETTENGLGLGAKAEEWFQDKIVGKNPGRCNFTVSKDGGEIDAITASTITSRAFLLAIQRAYDKLKESQDGQTGATQQVQN